MRRRTIRLGLLLLVATTIGCDQATKHLATTHLAHAPRRSFVGDLFRLEYAQNGGAFLSMGATLPPWARSALFTFGTAAVLVACAIVALRRGGPGAGIVGFAFVFAGGASNLVDRVQHGRVVDFLNVGVGALRTGIFDVADMAILLGVLLLALPTARAALETSSRPRDV